MSMTADKRRESIITRMVDRNLEARIRAAHPNMFESDEAAKAALDDYDRLKAEQDKAAEEA